MTEATLFISRAGADADFAAVIGEILQGAGYAVVLQQWDFSNRNFMERIHGALVSGARVVALLSPEYLRGEHCQAEWQNAIADDPLNTKSRLILLRVAECEPGGLLSGLAYWDLVPVRDNRALLHDIVLDAVREDRRDAVPSGRYWRAPRTIVDAEAIGPVPGFSGRDEELGTIAAALEGENATAAVHGLGGIGKSSIAREYAWRSRERYAVVWWLNAQTEDAIIDGLLRLGGLFVRGLDRLADRRAAAQQVTTTVLTGFSKPVLLIFDNLEDERLLRSWLPRTGARALATSRNAAWSPDITAIALPTWPPGTAIRYLRRESGRGDLTEADARAIVEALGALPLALAHAAASLRGLRMVTPERYLQHITEHLKNAPRNAHYPRSVFATLRTAIAQAEKEAPGAAAVLCFAAWFAPDAIPDELFRQAIDGYPAGLQPALAEDVEALDLGSALPDDVRLDEALGALDRLSLLAFSPASRTYSIHRLVQLAARDIVGGAALAWSECAVAAADFAFPKVGLETWPQCERLLPHARAALKALPETPTLLAAAQLAHNCAAYLLARGEYRAAEALQRRSLAILEKALGPDDPEVARSLNNLSVLCYQQGRYAETEPMHARVLAILEKALGPDHPDVAMSLNNLAGLYNRQGRYQEAEALHARVLRLREKALGPNHPDVAMSLKNLATLYDRQGRSQEAERLHARALAIRERMFGPDHPDVALSLNSLAVLYQEQGRFGEAEPLHARALAIVEKALGPDHPYVAASLNGLAGWYDRQGRYGEAEPLYARALLIREKAFGPVHPELAQTLSGLAKLYEAQGRLDEATPLQTRAVAVFEKTYGSDHELTRAGREDLERLRSKRRG